jgi:hypothetical protein
MVPEECTADLKKRVTKQNCGDCCQRALALQRGKWLSDPSHNEVKSEDQQ